MMKPESVTMAPEENRVSHNVDVALAEHNSVYVRRVNRKQYELVDHLGNVRVVITDVKTTEVVQNDKPHGPYKATLLASNNYYPFGMLQPERHWSTEEYRYGYNGKEMDNETKGEGNSYDFGARMYDPRTGRWNSADPFRGIYTSISPYTFAINSPISFIDANGKWVAKIDYNASTNKYSLTFIAQTADNLETLSKQLGLTITAILEADPYLANIEVVPDCEVKLERIQQVQEINGSINEVVKAQKEWNCANLAAAANGEDLAPQWTTNWDNNTGNIDILASDLSTDYQSVSADKASIGSIIHYRIDPTKYSEIATKEFGFDIYVGSTLDEAFTTGMKKRGFSDNQIQEFMLTKDYGELIGKCKSFKETLANERHFSVVILKNQSGIEVQSIIQKAGEQFFNFKVEDASSASRRIPYIETPVDGTQFPYYKKE